MNKDCFTPKVLEADCDNTPITFLTTEIEGVDDTVNPPLNGAYNNTIVKYLMTGHVYLYNSVGIPALLNEGSIVDDELSLDSTNPVQNKIITKALNDEAEVRETKDNELQQSIKNVEGSLTTALETEITNRENADNALRQQIENVDNNLSTAIDGKVDKVDGKGLSTNDYTNADKNIVDGLESKLDQDVINSIQISSNTSTDVLVLEDGKVNLWTGSINTYEVPLPVASSDSAGVMNAATFNAIADNSNKITNILQGTVVITGLSATPTQEELTTQWKAASGETELINGARIYDVTNHVNWTYYTNANEWLSVGAGGESISVNQWTNSAAGIIKGSTEEGQIFAEADGTGSVNGWDAVKSDIANNASNLTTLSNTVAANTTKLNGIEEGAEVNVNADWKATSGDAQIINKPELDIDTSKRNAWFGNQSHLFGDNGTFNVSLGELTGPQSSSVFSSAALGYGAMPTRNGEVNVGAGNAGELPSGDNVGFNGSQLRVIGGVYDGQLDTDAATFAQAKQHPIYAVNLAVTNDTPVGWASAINNKMGHYFITYNTINKFPSQPSQYGMVEIFYSGGSDIYQRWHSMASGPSYERSGNGTGWNGNASVSGSDAWKQVLGAGDYGLGGNTIHMESTDLNNYPTKSGFYDGVNGANRPITETNLRYYVTQQSYTDTYILQTCITFSAQQMFMRAKQDGTWGQWRRVTITST